MRTFLSSSVLSFLILFSIGCGQTDLPETQRDSETAGMASSSDESTPSKSIREADSESIRSTVRSDTSVSSSDGSRSHLADMRTDEAPEIEFLEVTEQSGVDFVHVSGDCEDKPFPAANGSGLAALDFDLDGLNDLFFLNGTYFPLSIRPDGPEDKCYRNLGDWQFRDVTEVTGLGSKGYSAGAATGDLNSDGFPDIYVNCFGVNLLYLNQGDGTYIECGHAASVDDPSWGTSALAFDFDGDGDLDLYVCNYAEWTWETNAYCGDRQKGIRIFCSPRTVKPVADLLFENLGDGTFREALQAAGLDRPPTRSQGIVAADVDHDGLPDLYLGNDLNLNSLFRNKGDGTFEDLTDISGAAVDFAGQIQAGMGVDVADVDKDGAGEIFVTNYEGEHNTLYRNIGDHSFQDVSQSQGLAASSMRWVGWGNRFTDFDLDGWLDLVITNGHTDNNLQSLGRDSQYEQPPLLFHNRAGRLALIESPPSNYFSSRHPGRSLCVADLDGDLRPDLVIGHKDRQPALLRNVSPDTPPKEFLVLDLKFAGVESNRSAIGLQLEIEGQLTKEQHQIKSGGSYLTSHPQRITFAIPQNSNGTSARIRWPNGRFSTLRLPEFSGSYTLVEGRETSFYSSPAAQIQHPE
jgi:hypothetical protein